MALIIFCIFAVLVLVALNWAQYRANKAQKEDDDRILRWIESWSKEKKG